MSTNYSTIQQHQPLRVPQGWDKQEKAFVVQLDEIFDDIYRRYGRLRMEDMSEAFRKRISDDEGNIAELVIDVGQITIDVSNKYDKVSGIAITADGVDITGSKYVKIRSGATFDVDSTNFSISSTNKKMVTENWEFSSSGMDYYNGTHTNANKVLHIGSTTAYPGYASLVHDFQQSGNTKEGVITIGIRYYTRGTYEHTYQSGIVIESEPNAGGVVASDDPTIPIPGISLHSQSSFGMLGSSGMPWDFGYINQINSCLKVSGDTNASFLIYLNKNAASNVAGLPYIHFREYYSGSQQRIKLSGSPVLDVDVGTCYYSNLVQNSSREIKHDIQPMESFGEKLDALQPVSFVYDSDPDENRRLGLIYEDAQEVMPEICTGDESNKAISYMELVPALLKEIQDLRARVAALEGGQ